MKNFGLPSQATVSSAERGISIKAQDLLIERYVTMGADPSVFEVTTDLENQKAIEKKASISIEKYVETLEETVKLYREAAARMKVQNMAIMAFCKRWTTEENEIMLDELKNLIEL